MLLDKSIYRRYNSKFMHLIKLGRNYLRSIITIDLIFTIKYKYRLTKSQIRKYIQIKSPFVIIGLRQIVLN
jgi:hypothetical protein